MYTIVGIDPGKTAGIVAIDLNGKLLAKTHRRFAGNDWLVRTIRELGTPVIIASDKPNASMVVKKINATFNSKLFLPNKELKIEEKREIAEAMNIRDPHERDAYVAAVKAFRAYANKFKQAEHIAVNNKLSNIDEIKAKVVEKYSINEAITNRRANRK